MLGGVKIEDGRVFEIISLRVMVRSSSSFSSLFSISAFTWGGSQSDLMYNFLLKPLLFVSPAKRYFSLTSLFILSIAFINKSFGGASYLMQNLSPSPSSAPSPGGGVR